MSTALEYTVGSTGQVSTNGFYREVTRAQWDSLTPLRGRPYSRYSPALEAIAQGKVIAFPAPTLKKAWNIRRSVALAAKRTGLLIEMRTARDPEVEAGILVLVRKKESLTREDDEVTDLNLQDEMGSERQP